MVKLLFDVGNSTCKYAEHGDGIGGLRVHSLPAADGSDIVSSISAEPDSGVFSIMVASVRSEDFNKRLSSALAARFGVRPVFVRGQRAACGVTTAYRQAGRLGTDRFMALLGAWSECHDACIVVDCGTAVVIDAINANGVHQGGVIMPGLNSLRKALYRDADLLPMVNDTGGAFPRALFARDTDGAILEGCLRMFASAVTATVREMQVRLTVAAPVFVTGGDSRKLFAETRMVGRYRPHLVLEGLAVFSDHASAPG